MGVPVHECGKFFFKQGGKKLQRMNLAGQICLDELQHGGLLPFL